MRIIEQFEFDLKRNSSGRNLGAGGGAVFIDIVSNLSDVM